MIIMGLEIFLSAALGIIFLASAIPKLRHPGGFILAVLEYQVLPPRLSWFYARLLPPLELLLALLLLSGTAVRLAALGLSLLLLSFIAAIGINLLRGRKMDCHCFGRAAKRPVGWPLLLEDIALLSAALTLAIVTHKWVTLEPWSLFRLSSLALAASFVPLAGCAAVTACIAILLNRSSYGRRRYGGGAARKEG